MKNYALDETGQPWYKPYLDEVRDNGKANARAEFCRYATYILQNLEGWLDHKWLCNEPKCKGHPTEAFWRGYERTIRELAEADNG